MKVEKIKGVLHFKDEDRGEAKFSLIDGSKQIFKNGKWEDRKTLSHYFAGLRVHETKDWFDGNDWGLTRTMEIARNGNKNIVGITTFLDELRRPLYQKN